MRAICLIALTLAACGSDADVMVDMAADMTEPRGEFCGAPGGTRCCAPGELSQPCTTNDTCNSNARCSSFFRCVAGSWQLAGPPCDMATPIFAD